MLAQSHAHTHPHTHTLAQIHTQMRKLSKSSYTHTNGQKETIFHSLQVKAWRYVFEMEGMDEYNTPTTTLARLYFKPNNASQVSSCPNT